MLLRPLIHTVSPRPKSYLVKGSDVTIYDSLSDLELTLEALDVANDTYTAFDSTGHRVHLELTGRRVQARISERNAPAELVDALRRYLASADPAIKRSDRDLISLLQPPTRSRMLIHARDAPIEDGPPILLLHGHPAPTQPGTESLRNWSRPATT